MSEEYATTRQDFLTATASYLGLDIDAISNDSILKTDDSGLMVAVLHVWLKPSDIIGIGKRMQAMSEAKPQEPLDTAIIEGPTVEAMREAYNALSKTEKGRYGSFARYMAESSTGIIDVYTGEPYENAIKKAQDMRPTDCKNAIKDSGAKSWPKSCARCQFGPCPYNADGSVVMPETGRKVVHVDVPEEPEPVSMDAVWLTPHEASTAQMYHASDYCPERGCLVQWAMLTDEQKQKAKERL